MKKLFVSLVAAIVATTACFGQSSLLATLSHEGTISTFYGAGALRAAHAAAADGDIITLSSGSFVSTDITKGITLRGAGMEVNSEVHGEPTIISGDFSINIPEETTERLTIEGIYHNATIGVSKRLENATFLKNRFRIFASNQAETIKNATFIHCRISERLSLMADCSAACVNCIIMNPLTVSQSTSNFEHLWSSRSDEHVKSDCVGTVFQTALFFLVVIPGRSLGIINMTRMAVWKTVPSR